VYVFSFSVEIPLWQCNMNREAYNGVFSMRRCQLHVLCLPLGVLVAMLDGCTVETTWELLSLLRDADSLIGTSGVSCYCNAQHCMLFSLQVLNLHSNFLSHEVPGGCARWRLGHFVFVNQQNAGYESKLSYLTSWTKKLEYIYLFFPPIPPFPFAPILLTP